MKTVYHDTLPSCDICKATDLSVVFDMPYSGGHFANVCNGCRQLTDNPDSSLGTRIVKGRHPDADPPSKCLQCGHPHKGGFQICEKCSAFVNHPFSIEAVLRSKDKAEKESKYVDSLSIAEIEIMAADSVVATADGCEVEPDGTCPHGYRSPLLILGIV